MKSKYKINFSELPKYDILILKEMSQIYLKYNNLESMKEFFQPFSFDLKNYHRALFREPSERLADLLELASGIYLADRLALRRPLKKNCKICRHWKREIRLTLSMRDLEFWKDPKVIEKLATVLDYITEDRWYFEFKPQISSYYRSKSWQINFAFDIPNNSFVSLFSGGLDSFAGIVTHLNKYNYDRVYLISIVTNNRMQGTQKLLAYYLRKKLALDIIYVPIPIHLRSRKVPEEKTQRSRGLLFTILGSVFAFHAGRNSLALFENGVGAINLPMVDFQIGTDNTRAVNPLAISEISKLLSMIFETSFEIKNFAQWSTKAELCQALVDSPLKDDISKTVSCDGSFSRRIRRRPQCGICTSCLLRRQALAASGLHEIDTSDKYQFDIYNASLVKEPKRLFSLKAMRKQISDIETCLKVPNQWIELIKSYPILEEMKIHLNALSGYKMRLFQEKVIRLYSTYVKEWHAFEKQINRISFMK